MTKNMTSGSSFKLILSFAFPLMLGGVFQQFYNMADTIIVGRFVGVEALAAVGSTGSLNYLVLGGAIGFCAGQAIPIARAFGAKQYDEMRCYYANALWLSLICAILVTTVTVAFTPQILTAMNTPQDIFADAQSYIRTVFVGIPAILLYNVSSAMMRALGDSKRPLYFLILSSVLNIVLDLVFILNFNMGVFGAALATIISQAVAGVLSFLFLLKHFTDLHCTKEQMRLKWKYCKVLCAMGLPMGLQCSITALGGLVLQSSINALGSVAVAAMTAGNRVMNMLYIPLDSIGTTLATFSSQNLGAKKLDRISQGMRNSTLMVTIYGIAVYFLVDIADVFMLSLFVDPSEVEIMAKSQQVMMWSSYFYVALGVLLVLRFVIQGLGFSTMAMMAGVAEMITRGGFAFLCVGPNGFLMACLSTPAAWIAACIYLIPAYIFVMRRLHLSIPDHPI